MATNTYVFELRRDECASVCSRAEEQEENEEKKAGKGFVPTAPSEVPSLRAHVVETLLPLVERMGGIGVYTSARSDLLADEREMAYHAERVTTSIMSVGVSVCDDVRGLLRLVWSTSRGIKATKSDMGMLVAVFVCVDDRIDRVVIYTTPVVSSQSPASQRNVACIVGPPRVRPDIKDIAWIRDRKDVEERGRQAMAKLGYGTPSDVLLCTQRGELLEGLITNLFVLVEDNSTKHRCRLQTAPEGTVLAGVARRKVIEACHELGIPVDLTCPRISERHLWQGVFLTNSIRQLQPLDRVCCVDTNVWELDPWVWEPAKQGLAGAEATDVTGVVMAHRCIRTISEMVVDSHDIK